jgi:DNA polymerase-3 subunit delta'
MQVIMFFKNILGHEFQKSSLIRAVRDSRISHSYLFFGPEGVGKRLVAIEFAKILNCLKTLDGESYSTKEPCSCNSCKKIDKGIHSDVFLVEYKGVKDIKVDQIREEVEERLFLKPFEGRFKVAIIDEAERMNPNAQSAFLKTLEEPPTDSIIILITSQPESLLLTIRSRCQLFEFKGVPDEILVDEIKKRTDLSTEEAWVATKLSSGSLGRALRLDKEVLAERKEMLVKLSNINPHYASHVLGFLESIQKGSSWEDMEMVSFLFEVISLWLRDLALVKLGFEQDALTNRDLSSLATNLASRWSVDNILDKMNFLQDARYAIFRGNANKQIMLENLVIKIAE